MSDAQTYDNGSSTGDTARDTANSPAWQEIPVKWGWLLALGLLFIVGGTLGVLYAVSLTIVSVLVFGGLAMGAGAMMLWHSFTSGEDRWSGRAMHIAIAVSYLVLGGLLLWNPVSGSISLTIILTAFLVAVGIIRIGYAWRCRRQGWRWRLSGLGGVIDLILAGLILAGWPATALWVIGLFVAVELIVSGWMLVGIALAARKAPHHTGERHSATT